MGDVVTRCVLHSLAKRKRVVAPFIFGGHSVCRRCLQGAAADVEKGISMAMIVQRASHGYLPGRH